VEYRSRHIEGGKFMKKILSLLCGSLIVLLMFTAPGNVVFAEKQDGSTCGCEEHGIFPVLGAEKNKIVAKLISSNEFKSKKKELTKTGYKWNGVSDVEVVEFVDETGRTIGVSVPFITKDKKVEMAVFINGKFLIMAPPME
jgi:hypothetical protein